jgi:hypothetical protein
MKLKSLFLVTFVLFAFFACKKKQEDPKPVEENELVTTVELTINELDNTGNVIANTTQIATWEDLDGTGPNAPVRTVTQNGATFNNNRIRLVTSRNYRINLRFLDKTKNPVENKTTEIESKGTEHQVFFVTAGPGGALVTTNAFSSFTYLAPFDTNNRPIGTNIRIVAPSTATTSPLNFRVILRHDLNKGGANVSTGDITNAGGSTDIDTNPGFEVDVVSPA